MLIEDNYIVLSSVIHMANVVTRDGRLEGINLRLQRAFAGQTRFDWSLVAATAKDNTEV